MYPSLLSAFNNLLSLPPALPHPSPSISLTTKQCHAEVCLFSPDRSTVCGALLIHRAPLRGLVVLTVPPAVPPRTSGSKHGSICCTRCWCQNHVTNSLELHLSRPRVLCMRHGGRHGITGLCLGQLTQLATESCLSTNRFQLWTGAVALHLNFSRSCSSSKAFPGVPGGPTPCNRVLDTHCTQPNGSCGVMSHEGITLYTAVGWSIANHLVWLKAGCLTITVP